MQQFLQWIGRQPAVRLAVVNERPVRPGHRFSDHRHDFHELGFVLEGRCHWVLSRRRRHRVEAGGCAFVPAGILHREEVPPGTSARLAWLGVAVDDPLPTGPVFTAPGPWSAELGWVLERITRERRQDALGAAERVACLVGEALVLLARLAAAAPGEAPPPPGITARQFSVLRSAARMLAPPEGRSAPLAAVARYHLVSPSHLASLFRRSLGVSPGRWRQRERLRAVEALLRDPALSIKEVAARGGFVDAAHLCHWFRARHGTTPGRWRRTAALPGVGSGPSVDAAC